METVWDESGASVNENNAWAPNPSILRVLFCLRTYLPNAHSKQKKEGANHHQSLINLIHICTRVGGRSSEKSVWKISSKPRFLDPHGSTLTLLVNSIRGNVSELRDQLSYRIGQMWKSLDKQDLWVLRSDKKAAMLSRRDIPKMAKNMFPPICHTVRNCRT